MRYSVIIPAAGNGSRMGAEVPKVLLPLGSEGHSIIRGTVSVFLSDPECERVVVCVGDEWRSRFESELGGLDKVTLVAGGETRQDSVRNGVEALGSLLDRSKTPRESACVLVHDAARRCISRAVIDRVVDGVKEHGAVTAAIPVPDSLATVADGEIVGGVDRDGVWAVQTPQGFLFEELRSAHFAARVDGFIATDDSSVVARVRPVRVVQGDRFNIKVTHPADMDVARRILESC